MLKKIIQKIKGFILKRKIKKGKVPRGRARLSGLTFIGRLYIRFISKYGWIKDYGLVSERCVTNAAANYIVDSFQNSTSYPLSNFKYHDSGTGTTSESVNDTSLQSPTGESRDVGSQTEGASSNIYKSVATHTYSGTYAITEHGIFSASTGGVLLDRSVFSAINVTSGDKIEFTYELQVNAGG